MNKRIALPGLLTAGLAAFLMVANYTLDGSAWAAFAMEPGVEHYFCEYSPLHRFIRQPLNTWSNLPFLWVGLWILQIHASDKRQGLQSRLIHISPFFGLLFGFCCILMWWGSSFFHASLTLAGEWWDLAAVYALSFLPLSYNLQALFLHHRFGTEAIPSTKYDWGFGLFWLTGTLTFSIMAFMLPAHVVVPILLGGTLGTLFLLQRFQLSSGSQRWLYLAGITLFAAICFFFMGLKDIFCHPHSLFQAHSLWHITAAASTLLYFLHIRNPE